MSKLPAFQFYPGDWRKDPGLQSLDLTHRGAWIEMLCMMHESQERGVLTLNGKPMPVPAIARQLGITADECEAIIDTLLDYGVAMRRPSDGAICSRRMIRDEEARIERKKKLSDAGRRGAQKKWGGDGVGHAEAMPDPKPGPCSENSSSSSSSPSGLSSAAQKKGDRSASRSDFDWDRDCPSNLNTSTVRGAMSEWFAYRRERKLAKWKPSTIKKQLAAFADDGPGAFVAAVEWSIRQQYQGLFAPTGGARGSPKSHAARSDSYNHAEDTSWLTEGSKSA